MCLLVCYIEVGLVKVLEEKGIGCLFIYVFMISKIMEENCGYVVWDLCEGFEWEYWVIILENNVV